MSNVQIRKLHVRTFQLQNLYCKRIPKEIVINHKKRKEVINMSSEKRFLNAKEIAEITGLSKEGSYKIIRELNDELTRKGFLTVRGKVINSYFYERFFGKDDVTNTNIQR